MDSNSSFQNNRISVDNSTVYEFSVSRLTFVYETYFLVCEDVIPPMREKLEHLLAPKLVLMQYRAHCTRN